MTKGKAVLLWVILGAIVLWLLWRNRSTVAPTVFNVPPESYLTVNYPSIQMDIPSLTMPQSSASCGCNPQASNIMMGAVNSIKDAESKIEQQLKDYTDSINNYFLSNTVI